jgi:DnaK suppressor protein
MMANASRYPARKLGAMDGNTARDRLLSDLARSEAELARLERDHVSLMQASEFSNADDEHDPEGATIAFEREQLVSIMARVQRTITDLRVALRGLADGRYGICVNCGEPIDPARLEVRPQARRCVACAERSR